MIVSYLSYTREHTYALVSVYIYIWTYASIFVRENLELHACMSGFLSVCLFVCLCIMHI